MKIWLLLTASFWTLNLLMMEIYAYPQRNHNAPGTYYQKPRFPQYDPGQPHSLPSLSAPALPSTSMKFMPDQQQHVSSLPTFQNIIFTTPKPEPSFLTKVITFFSNTRDKVTEIGKNVLIKALHFLRAIFDIAGSIIHRITHKYYGNDNDYEEVDLGDDGSLANFNPLPSLLGAGLRSLTDFGGLGSLANLNPLGSLLGSAGGTDSESDAVNAGGAGGSNSEQLSDESILHLAAELGINTNKSDLVEQDIILPRSEELSSITDDILLSKELSVTSTSFTSKEFSHLKLGITTPVSDSSKDSRPSKLLKKIECIVIEESNILDIASLARSASNSIPICQ